MNFGNYNINIVKLDYDTGILNKTCREISDMLMETGIVFVVCDNNADVEYTYLNNFYNDGLITGIIEDDGTYSVNVGYTQYTCGDLDDYPSLRGGGK